MSWVYPPGQGPGYAAAVQSPQGDLVDSVKKLQRTDPEAKQAWVWYTSEYGENTRDPSKHTAQFLEDFLRQYNGGTLTGLSAPPEYNAGGSYAGGSYAGGSYGSYGASADDGPSLAELVRSGQRKSATWRKCWSQYRENYGQAGFKNDPAAHDEEFLVSFLEFLGSHGLRAFANMAAPPSYEPAPVMQPLHVQGPPAKRPRVAAPLHPVGAGAPVRAAPASYGPYGPASYGASAYGDASYAAPAAHSAGARVGKWGASSAAQALEPAKRLLVDRVKAFQRQSAENRELWSRFADDHLDGTKDPAKVEAEQLQLFVSSFGVAELPDAQAAGAPPDPSLVGRVKAFQRNGDAQKQAWWQFCDTNLSGTRDPARADSGQLQLFLDSVGA